MKGGRAIVAIWLLVLFACGFWLQRHLSVATDLTVFLPPSSSPVQRLLLTQLREGPASRLILIALDGAETAALARASMGLSDRLKKDGLFSFVSNGSTSETRKERQLLFDHRYLLSPGVDAERFSVDGLRSALLESLELLGSPAGLLVRPTLAADPTGEVRAIARLLLPEGAPAKRHGVWFSGDGKRALLVAETRATGFDVEGQERAIHAIEYAFGRLEPKGARIELAGPGVFAAQSRATIVAEAWRLSMLAAILVLGILSAAYRSIAPVATSMLPVVTGLTVGVTVVGVAFGAVHGITLAFGATLIGVAVDYPSYLFAQTAYAERLERTAHRIGPTLRLAVLTTAMGSLAMALSSFTGLAQLGVLTIAGVTAAGATARYVLPSILPFSLHLRTARMAPNTLILPETLRRVAAALAVGLVVAGLGIIWWAHGRLWNDDLASLAPVPAATKERDRALRSELGAPDVRYMLVARGTDREGVLRQSESLDVFLLQATAKGWLAGFDLPSRYLPSRKTQEARRAALPERVALARNLEEASRDLPFRPALFAPFLEAVERARSGPLVDLATYRSSALERKIESLLLHDADGWIVLAPLRGVLDPDRVGSEGERAGFRFIDLKADSNRLVSGYRRESLQLIALGLLCIAALLVVSLRSATRAIRVLTPALGAVVLVVAILLLSGNRISLFNLVALLLVVGIALNYALFFERPQRDASERARTQLALLVCGGTTLSAFGCLALSALPVLHAIGITVALGSLLSLALAAAFAGRPANPP